MHCTEGIYCNSVSAFIVWRVKNKTSLSNLSNYEIYNAYNYNKIY